jgi:cellobiose phosphorylase
MYRLLLESLLGLRLENGQLHFAPCLPPDWTGFEMSYRYRATIYRIAVVQMPASAGEQGGVSSLVVDGVEQSERLISLVDDLREHQVSISCRLPWPA